MPNMSVKCDCGKNTKQAIVWNNSTALRKGSESSGGAKAPTTPTEPQHQQQRKLLASTNTPFRTGAVQNTKSNENATANENAKTPHRTPEQKFLADTALYCVAITRI